MLDLILITLSSLLTGLSWPGCIAVPGSYGQLDKGSARATGFPDPRKSSSCMRRRRSHAALRQAPFWDITGPMRTVLFCLLTAIPASAQQYTITTIAGGSADPHTCSGVEN